MEIDGQCHCGKIKFSGETESNFFGICHCNDCQTNTGTAYRAIVNVPAKLFHMVGKPTEYLKTTSDSGTPVTSAFCGSCGSPIYSCAVVNPKFYRIRLGLLRQKSEFVPRVQIWKSAAFSWVNELSDVPSHPGNISTA